MTNLQFVPNAVNAGECVSSGWEMLKRNYGMYLGIALITLILTGCIPCLNIFLIGPIMGGVFYVVLRDMRGEPVEFGMMFKGFEKFVPLMVIGLIQSIPGVIAQIVQYVIRFAEIGLNTGRGRDLDFFQSSGSAIGAGVAMIAIIFALGFMAFGIIWWLCFFCAVPLAMEYDLSPIDAIKLSARAGMSNVGGLIVLLLFQILIVLLGVVMICLGVFFFSMPLVYIANAFAYRQIFPYLDEQYRNMAPTPPAYGAGYGQGQWPQS